MNITIPLSAGCEGWFKLVAVRIVDGVETSRDLTDWFRNLITDQGIDYMGGNSNWKAFCQVGSGNTAPSFSDVALQTFVAGVARDSLYLQGSYISGPPDAAQVTSRYRFGVGAAAGNLAEVGVGWASTGNTLFSRALILDGFGVPTTITVLSDEILDVYYSFRVYPPASDVMGSVSISGSSYNYVIRAAAVNSILTGGSIGAGWGGGADGQQPTANAGFITGLRPTSVGNGTLGARTGGPSGTLLEPSSTATLSYTPGTFYRDITNTYGVNNGNAVGGVNVGTFANQWGTFQISFSPALAKDNTKTMSFTFRFTWARH